MYQTVVTAEENGNRYIFKPRCKQWKCPYCAVVNKKVWRSRIMNEIESTPQMKVWYFYTFTLLGKDHSGLKHSLSVWRDQWAKLRKRLKRDLGKFRYVRVFEMHKDKTLHIHMLADASYDDCIYIDATDKQKERRESSTLRKHLNELQLGYIHDIKVIKTKDETNNGIARNVSAYITKYMTKDIQTFVRNNLSDSKIRLRMIQTSYKWFNEGKHDMKLNWDRSPLFETEYLNLPRGKEAYDITTDRKVNIDDFHEYNYYPNKISDLIDIAESEDIL